MSDYRKEYTQDRFNRLMDLKMKLIRTLHTNPGVRPSLEVVGRQIDEFPNYKDMIRGYAKTATRIG